MRSNCALTTVGTPSVKLMCRIFDYSSRGADVVVEQHSEFCNTRNDFSIGYQIRTSTINFKNKN